MLGKETHNQLANNSCVSWDITAQKPSIKDFRLAKSRRRKLSVRSEPVREKEKEREIEFTTEFWPMIRFNHDHRGERRGGRVFFLLSGIFSNATTDFRAQCRALSERMQKANWNGRKTCVAVTVHTYRLSLAVLLTSSFSRFSLSS